MTYDFRRFTSVNDMTDAQRRAWHQAGKPELGPEPRPKPAQPAAMTPDASRTWDRWAVAHVERGMDSCMYTVGQEVGKIERALLARIDALERELGSLRAEVQVERSARVIDLPRLPLRRKRNDAAA